MQSVAAAIRVSQVWAAAWVHVHYNIMLYKLTALGHWLEIHSSM